MDTDEASLPDFAKQYKLEATFKENSVEHTYTAGGEDVAMGNSGVEDQSTELWANIGCIGNGASGSVWLQRETSSRKMRAVKKVLRDRTPMQSLSRELRSLIVVRDCEHVVKLFGWYESVDFYFIAMEYAEHGDLNQHLMNTTTKPAIEHVKEITTQILKALVILHSKDICHRDLKPQNVLITSLQPIHIKLADFGISKSFEGTELRTMLGTPGFLAPEVLGTLPQKFRSKGSNSYTKAVDIWALGCLVYNMLTLEAPFLAPTSTESQESTILSVGGAGVDGYCQRELDYDLLYQYCNGGDHIIISSFQSLGVSEDEITFVNRLLVVDPKSRISAAAALMDPWFLQGLCGVNDGSYYLKDHDGFLIEAARYGRVDLIYTFLSAGYDVRRVDSMGDTALHLAAMNGHHDAVRLLLEKGADLNGKGSNGTALCMAASSGHAAVVQLLLKKGADLKAKGPNGTALCIAASLGHAAVVLILLERIWVVSALKPAKPTARKAVPVDNDTPTTLHSAAFVGRYDIVKVFLKNGVDVNSANSEGRTPLHEAAMSENKAVVLLLIRNGADVNAADSEGCTPLHKAAMSENKAVVLILIKKGANVNAADSEGCTPLHKAATSGIKAVVLLLIERGADLNAADSKGYTPLHWAVISHRGGEVRLLHKMGADMNAGDENGRTPLYQPVSSGDESLTRLLLVLGGDPNAADLAGMSLLHHARKESIVRILVDGGADLSAVDKKGSSVLHRAASHGEDTCLQLLLKLDASLIDAVNPEGSTPLHIATFRGREDNVRLLLEEGADLSAVDKKGNSVLHRAASHSEDTCLQLLLKRDASLISAVNSEGSTPLHIATSRGRENNARLLLEGGADLRAVDKLGRTPVSVAKYPACEELFREYGVALWGNIERVSLGKFKRI